jgi:hypothetical protein
MSKMNISGPVCTLQRKSDLCIPRNETARPCSQFPLHVYVSDLYIPTIRPPILLQQIKQTDLNICFEFSMQCLCSVEGACANTLLTYLSTSEQ